MRASGSDTVYDLVGRVLCSTIHNFALLQEGNRGRGAVGLPCDTVFAARQVRSGDCGIVRYTS